MQVFLKIFLFFLEIIKLNSKYHRKMKKKIFDFTTEKQLTHAELLQIKGGRFLLGPDDLVDDDIDMPDLTLATGPDELVDDDIDMPDISLVQIGIF